MAIDVIGKARGRWRGILGILGIGDQFLTNKPCPCPMCGGKDRYLWDNKGGRGTYFCRGCGAGDGIELLKKYHGWDFKKSLKEISGVMGMASYEKPISQLSKDDQRTKLRSLWTSSGPVQKGDAVDRYLTDRGVGEMTYPKSLRTCEKCWFSHDRYHPAMIAVVTGPDGQPVTLHRTYLADNGEKLDVPEPRRLMPGSIPPGSAIRLSDAPGHVLGIAEGVETAMAASHRFEIPVWSAINASMMKQWIPPDGVEEVVVFGDNDKNFAGQSAAFTLAHRLAIKAFEVSVKIPNKIGTDWAD